MPTDIYIILLTLISSAVCGMAFTPLILKFCKKKHLYDMPNARKVHKNPIPRLGGIAFIPSMIVAVLITFDFLRLQYHSQIIHINVSSLHVIVSLFVIYMTGIIDDLIGLNAPVKFTLQIISGVILTLAGFYLNNLYGLFGIYEIPQWLGSILTVFIIVFVCNAINLIDGIDGLAASLAIIGLCGFCHLYVKLSYLTYCVLICGIIGCLLSYLFFNLFGSAEKGLKIFMGDSGSLTLGFLLGFLFINYSIKMSVYADQYSQPFSIAWSFFILPIFDVVRVFFFRIMNHRSPFQPDKNHIHHKLLAAGLTQHQALLALIALALAFILINRSLSPLNNANISLLADVIIYIAFNICVNVAIKRRKKVEVR